MKKLACQIGIISFGLFFMAEMSNAALITVGEGDTGEGRVVYGNIDGVPLTSHYGTDPSGGVAAGTNVLYYDLPAPYTTAVTGDVRIRDPWESNTIQDVIRFDGNAHLIFYSYGAGSSTTGADLDTIPWLSVRDNPLTNNVVIFEQGTESNNWADYVATSGQPGFVNANNPTYKFLSDVSNVPEPTTLGLFSIGLAAMGFGKRRHEGRRLG